MLSKIMTGARRAVKFSVLDPSLRREIKSALSDIGCRVLERGTMLDVRYEDCTQQAILSVLTPYWNQLVSV